MNKSAKRFLLWTFPISYLCFGVLIWMDFRNPSVGVSVIQGLILLLGCLGPVFGAVLGGGKGTHFDPPANQRSWLLVALLLVLHYLFAGLLRLTRPVAVGEFNLFLIPLALILGAQALGWQGIFRPALTEGRRPWKATVATGLIYSLWIMPLLYVPTASLRADMYLPFAVWLVGLTLLQTTLVQRTGSILCAAVFTSLYFLLSALMPFVEANAWYISAAIDLVLAFLYNSKMVKQNNEESNLLP